MLRLVTVSKSNRIVLPDQCKNLPENYVFKVLKERNVETKLEYLLSIPPELGGQKEFDYLGTWWVVASYCQSAYKTGQRWKFEDSFIVEFTEDTHRNVKIVQSWRKGISIGEILPTPTVEDNHCAWE